MRLDQNPLLRSRVDGTLARDNSGDLDYDDEIGGDGDCDDCENNMIWRGLTTTPAVEAEVEGSKDGRRLTVMRLWQREVGDGPGLVMSNGDVGEVRRSWSRGRRKGSQRRRLVVMKMTAKAVEQWWQQR